MLVLMTCRACPSLVPRKEDLKSSSTDLIGTSGMAWRRISTSEASALSSDVVTKKKIHREAGILNDDNIDISISRRYVG